MGQAAIAREPLSAIDWLSAPLPTVQAAQPVPKTQKPRPKPNKTPPPPKLPVAESVTIPSVSVSPLDAPKIDAAGLLPSSVTGLPATLWQDDTVAELSRTIKALPDNPLPALQALIFTVLLAEANPPFDSTTDGAFLRARVMRLQSYGAVFQARALIEQIGAPPQSIFDLWFDTALLLEAPNDPCQALRENPELSRSYATRIYCTARLGDWATAALTYDTALSLDLLDDNTSHLLAVYLDPELAELDLPKPRPSSITPLIFRLWESAGIRLPTLPLPLPYAVTDLSENVGWKAQIAAAERLTRHSALSPNHLLGLYTDRKPAASGGVWDRARAVQSIDKAIAARNPEKVARLLPKTWAQLSKVGLGPAFAEMFAERLIALDLPPDTERLALYIGLLSSDYERYATRAATYDSLAFAASVALGDADPKLQRSTQEEAVLDGFTSYTLPRDPNTSLGRHILETVQLISTAGLNTDRVGRGLAQLRTVGLEDIARRVALQWLLLEAPS